MGDGGATEVDRGAAPPPTNCVRNCCTRDNWFRTSLICAMVLKLTTYFIVVPSLTHMAVTFNVTENTILQTGTVYEAGKFVGCIAFGVLGDQYNLLHVIGRSMEVYVGVAVALLLWVYLAPIESLQAYGIFIFFPFYFIISVASVASQFGLVILKLLSTKQGARRWILIQAILSGSLQGTYMLVGSLFVDAFGWTSTFVFMTAFAVVARFWLLAMTRKEHYEPCSVEAREKKRMKSDSTVAKLQKARAKALKRAKAAGEDGNDAAAQLDDVPPPEKCVYMRRVVELYFSGKHVEYVLYVVVLGCVTATMYCFPATALLVLVDYGGLGNWTDAADGKDSQVHGTTIIFIVFLFNFGARVVSLFLIKRFTSAQFVFFGICSIGAGTALLLVLSLTTEPSIAQIVVPGVLLLGGVGSAQPMCKAGALLSISDRLANTATSMLKIMQLFFAVVISYIAGALFDGTMMPLAATFAVMNLTCLAVWVALHKGSRQDCAWLCCRGRGGGLDGVGDGGGDRGKTGLTVTQLMEVADSAGVGANADAGTGTTLQILSVDSQAIDTDMLPSPAHRKVHAKVDGNTLHEGLLGSDSGRGGGDQKGERDAEYDEEGAVTML